jgi:hypothetical protein
VDKENCNSRAIVSIRIVFEMNRRDKKMNRYSRRPTRSDALLAARRIRLADF